MPASRPLRSGRPRRIPKPLARVEADPRIQFLRRFLAKPRQVASIVPSSRFLERRVVRVAEPERAGVVVELGPGTGGTTRALLRSMRPDARLLAIEIDPRLAELVRERIHDPRLTVHCGSAEHLREALEEAGLGAPDLILSGIPFSQIPREVGRSILAAARDVLRPGGRFVAYQARDRVAVLGREIFGPPVSQLEIRNVPPMRVYRFEKPAAGPAPAPR